MTPTGREAVMPKHRTRLASILTLAVVALPGVADAAPSRMRWTPCHADVGPRFECAVAQVPLDYDRPRGEAISIALTRLPATDPTRRLGSLFLTPRGPGGSGVDFVLFAGPPLYTPEARARFDLVGFDPRGSMRSTPLRCFDSPEQWPQFPPAVFPITRAQEQQQIAFDRTLDRACAQRGGPIRDHMSTANAARDLDVLRDLVGDDKLTYAGVSYGSYLGVTYANLFPGRVRALVVDGVLDPIAWSTGRSAAEACSFPSRPACTATPARRPRCRSSSGCATRAVRAVRSPAERRSGSPLSRAGCCASPSRSRTRTARPRRSTTRP